MDDHSNTIDLDSCTTLEDDDREYYGNAGHLVRPPVSRQQRRERREEQYMVQAGLNVA